MKSVVILAALALSACAGEPNKLAIHVDGSILTSSSKLAQGRTTPVTSIASDERIFFITHFSWTPIDAPGGFHKVDFRWFKDGTLVSHYPVTLNFNRTPYSMQTWRSGYTMGVGHFHVESWLEDSKVGQADFDVHA